MKNSILIVSIVMGSVAMSATGNKCGDKSRTVEVMVTTPAGGTTDMLARHLDAAVKKRPHLNLVVNNNPSASGTLAAQKVINEKKQILVAPVAVLTVAPQTMGKALDGAKPTYDHTDLTPISYVAQTDDVLVCHKDKVSNATTPDQLLAHLKKTPEVVYGSVGSATFPNILFLDFMKSIKEKNKVAPKVQEIPFQKVAEAQQSLVTGALDCFFIPMALVEPTIKMSKDSKLVAIGTTAPAPVKINGQDVPRLADSITTPDFGKLNSWVGVYGAKGMPQELRECVQQEIEIALNDPALQTKYQENYFRAKKTAMVGKDFEAFVKTEIPRWDAPVAQIKSQLKSQRDGGDAAAAGRQK